MSVEDNPAIAVLRLELKSWEKNFACTNGGRKAGREDIKRDPTIAAKYREYDRLRRPIQISHSTPKKQKTFTFNSPSRAPTTTTLAPNQVATPSRRHNNILFKSPVQPSPAREPSPTPQAIRQRLGPTPQKDGQILGLFDNFYSSTPSKPRDPLSLVDGNVAATPSKGNNGGLFRLEDEENSRLGKTPTSSGKRFMLDAFATPMKRKRGEEHGTPSSERRTAETPAFLRRTMSIPFNTGLDPLDEIDESVMPGSLQPPFKKRGLVRSLSAIIKNMKDQEEQDADEELALMRELEEEEAIGDIAPPGPNTTTNPAILVGDSQIEMPLGPDRGEESSEDDDVQGSLGPNGLPRKVWKKKGQKRTTRRVIMRPVKQKKQPAQDSQVVEETQVADNVPSDLDNSDDDENEDSDADETPGADGDAEYNGSKKRSQPAKPAEAKECNNDKADVGPIKRAARKITASTHANFCKLKIKNKNTKANGRGRFGRR